MPLKSYIVSSLEKVFPDTAPTPLSVPLSLLQGDQVSFQAVLFPEAEFKRRMEFRVHADAASCLDICVRKVAPIAVQLPAFDASDGNYLRTEPGLYPDRLAPLYEEDRFFAISKEWSALWIEIRSSADTPAGIYPLVLTVESETDAAEIRVEAEVIGCTLPQQTLKHTEWFHCDGIAQYYHEPVWSERYWSLLQRQVEAAARRGINMLLVPIWTPPLDTRVGHERLTTQLVDITLEGDAYRFDFSRFRRFIRLCLDAGIRYFEMAHLFTQWGARHCPKIMAVQDGV